MSWRADHAVPPGHTMTYRDALHVVSTNVLTKLVRARPPEPPSLTCSLARLLAAQLVPAWAMGLTEKTREVRRAYEEYEVRARARPGPRG
jgi:hypothetical protein